MLFGEYHHQLDEKNRMRMPVKLKSNLGEKYIVTKGTSSCLFVFSSSEMETIYSKLKELPITDISIQKALRTLFSSAYEVEEDAQGRFILPSSLKEFARINKNIVSIGVGNRVEIWSEEVWKDYNTSSQNFDEILTELNKYGV
jgi:MraZ protein